LSFAVSPLSRRILPSRAEGIADLREGEAPAEPRIANMPRQNGYTHRLGGSLAFPRNPCFHAQNSVTALRTFLAQVDFPHRGRRNRDKLCLCMSALVQNKALGPGCAPWCRMAAFEDAHSVGTSLCSHRPIHFQSVCAPCEIPRSSGRVNR
jgi:hypothetical protein